MIKPAISIIVPIYNVSAYLHKCIESILCQSFVNYELILVVDGSPDSSLEICKEFQKKDQRIKVINKSNGGLLSARKAGVKVASAEYIAFVDGDDWIDIDFLHSMYRLVQLFQLDFVISGFMRAFEGRIEKIKPFYKEGIYQSNDLKLLVHNMLNTSTFFQHGVSTYVWNKLFKTQLIRKVLHDIPNEITMGEDAAITYSYLAQCNKIGITHCCNYFYRQRINSMVKSAQNVEVEKLHLYNLIDHLSGSLRNFLDSQKLKSDLLYYLYSQSLVRFGGLISDEIEYMPFNGLNYGDRVILYSSGTFGQKLVVSNEKHKFFKLISWLDLDHLESNFLGLNVISPYVETNENYDSILIASIDGSQIDNILNMLSLYGFDCNKYRALNLNEKFVLNYLSKIGFNLNFYNE